MGIKENLVTVKNRILQASEKAGRSDRVELVAVSKTFPADCVRQALLAGQRIFGENRVQEAAEKWPALKTDFPDAKLHLIGPLQTNKAHMAVELFDCIETLDRPKLVGVLEKELVRRGKTMEAFIQVNIGDEPQKSGVSVAGLAEFVDLCRNTEVVVVSGLMCIPPFGEPALPYFERMATLAVEHKLSCLSMGMSGDFELAVAAGATHVRVGTSIFGQR